MSKYTKQDIIRIAEEEDVEFIRLQFTDMFGTLKNVAVTKSQLEKALNNQCMFDASSIEGFLRIEETDMYLYPDLDTFEIFPWRPKQGKVAGLICDVYNADGTPYAADTRLALKRVVEKAKQMGYVFEVEPKEAEITPQEYERGIPFFSEAVERYHLTVSGFRVAGEEDYGLETTRLVFEKR